MAIELPWPSIFENATHRFPLAATKPSCPASQDHWTIVADPPQRLTMCSFGRRHANNIDTVALHVPIEDGAGLFCPLGQGASRSRDKTYGVSVGEVHAVLNTRRLRCPRQLIARNSTTLSESYELQPPEVRRRQRAGNVSCPTIAAENRGSGHPRPGERLRSRATHDEICSTQGICTLDGASDTAAADTRQPSPKRSRPGSLDDSSALPNPRRRLRFASTDKLQSCHTSDNTVTPDADLFDRLVRQKMAFSNPFRGEGGPPSPTLSNASEASDYVRPNAFPGHRDTLARIKHPRIVHRHDESEESCSDCEDGSRQLISLLEPALPRIMPSLSAPDIEGLQLDCREKMVIVPDPESPAVNRVPAEILLQIYQHLSPAAFDAARRTCRAWFVASLDQTLLRLMLRRAKCYLAAQSDLQSQHKARSSSCSSRGHDGTDCKGLQVARCGEAGLRYQPKDEFLVARRLATECKLSTKWKGPGFKLSPRTSIKRVTNPLVLTHEVNLYPLAHPPDMMTINFWRPCKVFTVSSCVKYVLVVSGSSMWIFRLFGPREAMEPVCKLRCSRKILAVSMDTRSGRHSVGILHEGRIGACWDLSDRFFAQENVSELHEKGTKDTIREPRQNPKTRSDATTTLLGTLPTRRAEVINTSSHADGECKNPALEGIVETPRSLSFQHPDDHEGDEGTTSKRKLLDSSQWNLDIAPQGIPVESSQPTIFSRLGHADDVPRSVAICPDRRCVAFGCRMGLELHWVDALTLGELSRWFPLAAPSDYLHFLPARREDKLGHKIRLISSAAGHGGLKTIRAGSAPSSYAVPRNGVMGQSTGNQSNTQLFSGDMPFPPAVASPFSDAWPRLQPQPVTDERQGVLQTLDSDHYNAVPLSDGVNMLYTDPSSGLVSLGSDAPLGSPTKLLRKVFFIPPGGEGSSPPTPICYAAAPQLRWGCRIVAAYDDGSLVLFNVPSDTFDQLGRTTGTLDVWDECSGTVARSDLAMDAVMENSMYVDGSSTPESSGSVASQDEAVDEVARPLQIQGCLIDTINNGHVEDLALDCSSGGLKVWAFVNTGLAKLWDVYDRNEDVKRSVVTGTGLMSDAKQVSPVLQLREQTAARLHDDEGRGENTRFGQVKFSAPHDA